ISSRWVTAPAPTTAGRSAPTATARRNGDSRFTGPPPSPRRPSDRAYTSPVPGVNASIDRAVAEQTSPEAAALLAGWADATLRPRHARQDLLDMGPAAGPGRLAARGAGLSTAHSHEPPASGPRLPFRHRRRRQTVASPRPASAGRRPT